MGITKKTFYDALLEFAHAQGETRGVKVIDFEEETYQYGGCETCSFSETVVEVTMKDAEGKSFVWKYSSSFVDLINALTTDTPESEPEDEDTEIEWTSRGSQWFPHRGED